MDRLIKITISVSLYIFILLSNSNVYAFSSSNNMGVMEFINLYNSMADYLTQQNTGRLQSASFQDIKINILNKPDNTHVYAGLISDGIAVYLAEDNYGKFQGVMFLYSSAVINKENASNEMFRKGEIIGASVMLSLVAMGVPLNILEGYSSRDEYKNELMQVILKSLRDPSHRYSMTTYSSRNNKNIIFVHDYNKKLNRFIATIAYK